MVGHYITSKAYFSHEMEKACIEKMSRQVHDCAICKMFYDALGPSRFCASAYLFHLLRAGKTNPKKHFAILPASIFLVCCFIMY